MFNIIIEMQGKGYSIPSFYAQFVAFFATYLTLFLLLRHNPDYPYRSSTYIPIPFQQRLALAQLSMLCIGAIVQSRTYLIYYIVRQVYIGVLASIVYVVGQFVDIGLVRHFGVVDILLDTLLARQLQLRDLVINEDVVDASQEQQENRKKRIAESKVGKKNK